MKKFYTLLILTFCYYTHLTAQLTPIDSLELSFNNATSDTARFAILLKNFYAKYFDQPEKAIRLYQKGYELAQRLDNKRMMAQTALYIGNFYMYGKSDEGTGFQWLEKGLIAAETANDCKSYEYLYYSMAIVYSHQGFREKGLEAFEKSFEYAEKCLIPEFRSVQALVASYIAYNKFEKAFDIAQRGIKMLDKPGVPFLDKLYAYSIALDVVKEMPTKEQEKKNYSQKIKTILDNNEINTPSYEDLAIIFYLCDNTGDRKLAVKYAYQILKLKGENRLILSLKSDAHKYLAQVYEEQKNYPLCIQHWKQYKTLMDKSIDTLLSQEPGRKVIKAESERDLLIKQKEVDRQKWMSILGFSVAFFVLFGAIINYRFYKREQERKQELASLNATKDRLFAILSHDLMSPIGTLKNYLSLMDWGVMNQEQFSQSSERLKIKVNNLYNLLENVLHWSITQMQGIKPKVETVNINEVVSEQIALVSSIAETKGITLTQAIKSDATIQADKNHLRLIVRNLLQNALKFTPKGGTIHFSREDTEGGQKLTIQDTGIGMPNETLDKLFKVEQNTNRKGTAQEGGTGLGLILTKELVELNGGKITVSSEEGRGTTFSVVF